MGTTDLPNDEDRPPKPLQCTLILPRRRVDDALLLAKKARGMGVGKWLGFGGKLEPGEKIEAAALREMREETGVILQQGDVEKVGLTLFTFENKPNFFLEVHVFYTYAVNHIPHLCDEFDGEPTWFTREELPLKNMYEDFSMWSKYMFSEKRFYGRFHYGSDDKVKTYALAEVKNHLNPIIVPPKWVNEPAGPALPEFIDLN